jgi:hypothetical protein
MNFNINNTIFIKLDNLNEREIFSICVEYSLVFETLTTCKNTKLNLYIDNKLKKVVATSNNDNITFLTTDNIYYGGLTKREYDSFLAIKPTKVPKLKVNETSINLYKELNEKGFLRIDKFDNVINSVNDVNIDSILEEFGINGITPFEEEKQRGITITIKDNKIKRDISYYDIDTILDKIGLYGVNSLTKDEQKFLNDNN